MDRYVLIYMDNIHIQLREREEKESGSRGEEGEKGNKFITLKCYKIFYCGTMSHFIN